MSIVRAFARLVLCAFWFCGHAAAEPIAEADVVVRVVDPAARAVPAVLVFAADPRTDKITKIARAGADGVARIALPLRAHNFGLLTPGFGIERLFAPNARAVTLVVRPIPAANLAEAPGAASLPLFADRAVILRGRVLDETGAGLWGVRIEALRPGAGVAAIGVSGGAGEFALAVPGGHYTLVAKAPGLKPARIDRDAASGRITAVMAISAAPQTLAFAAGHVLRFRIDDSLDPEYYPPAPVLAWLRYAYGVCPSIDPPTAHQRRSIKKYWWLDLLREAPPSPAQRTTFANGPCRPALGFLELATSWRTENKSGGFGPLP